MDSQHDNPAITYLPHEARSPDAPNGAAAVSVAPSPPPAPAGLRIGRRLEWFPRPGDHDDASDKFREAYPGFQFKLWVNYPQRLALELNPGGEDKDENERRARTALKQIVLEHNSWIIEDEHTGADVLLPSPTTDEFWERIPTEMATAIVLFVIQVPGKLPFSMIDQRRSSRRG